MERDLLFKKPWTLSPKMEFMIGIGPEWIHANERSMTANSVAGEGILDFMYWPSAKHKFGWYVEPGYEYSFGRGHEQSVGISGGLLSRDSMNVAGSLAALLIQRLRAMRRLPSG